MIAEDMVKDYASNLVRSSTLDCEEQVELEKELMEDIEQEQLSYMIEYLLMNQLDAVSELGYLSQTNINNHVARVTS